MVNAILKMYHESPPSQGRRIPSCSLRSEKNLTGFTLLEMSIVLVIIALITGSGILMGQSMMDSAKLANTNNKLNTIEAALYAYRMANNRIPCPTDPAMTETSDATHFGYEAANNGISGNCTGGTPAVSINYSMTGVDGQVVEGAVPVRTLSLPDEFMFDGWGRKFAYAVWTGATGVSAFLNYGLKANCGAITVNNAGGSSRTTAADYVLLSYGPDGHGGYLAGGTRMNAGSDNTDEQTDCHCDASLNPKTYKATYVQKDWTQDPADAKDSFDDLVRFKERWQLINEDDKWNTASLKTCSQPGIRIDGTIASENSGYQVASGDVNCDGVNDLVINATGSDTVYVVFGTNGGFPNPLVLNTLNGTNGFSFGMWRSVASLAVGDLDGDGCADIAVGTGGGDVTVFFGHGGSFNSYYANGTIYDGCTAFDMWDGSVNGGNTGLGGTLAFGDVSAHHNGIQDLVMVNSPDNRLYVLFGKTNTCTGAGHTAGRPTFNDGVPADYAAGGYDLQYLNANSAGLYVTGNGADFIGSYGGLAEGGIITGDVNNDGIQDILIGQKHSTPPGATTGALYVLFGRSSASWLALNGTNLTPAFFDGTKGFYIYSSYESSYEPGAMAVGDVNGDGKNDIAFSIPYGTYGSAHNSASAIVMWGKASYSASYNIDTMVGNGQAIYIGGTANSTSYGFGAIAISDINHDGYGDVIIGCGWCTDSADGSVYVVYGGPSLANLDMAVTPLNGTNGFRIDCSYAQDFNHCGDSLAALDLNGDSISDIAMSIPTGNGNGASGSGYTYVLFGGGTWTSPYTLSTIY